jgi:hypothetical protein
MKLLNPLYLCRQCKTVMASTHNSASQDIIYSKSVTTRRYLNKVPEEWEGIYLRQTFLNVQNKMEKEEKEKNKNVINSFMKL